MDQGAPAVAAQAVRAGGARKPSAASQVALLVQALQNGDADMLDQVLALTLTLPKPSLNDSRIAIIS